MGILHKKVVNFNSTSIVVPKILTEYLLHASHDSLGHVGATKLYHFIKIPFISQTREIQYINVRTCKKCQIMNLQKPNYRNLHHKIVHTLQDHLSVDLIRPYNTTTQGNTYALTAICNLTCYLMTTPIPDRMTSTHSCSVIFRSIP